MMIVGPLKKWFFSRQIRKTPLVVAVSIVTKVVIGNGVRKPLFGVSMRRIHNVYLVHDDGSEALPLYSTNDKPPQRGGAAVPFPALGKVEMACPRVSHPRATLSRTILLIFCPCCPMRGHIWTAFLNPIDRPSISFIFFRKTLPSPSFHPKPLLYSSHSPLILIFMLLLISGDIHPNSGPIDPCSVCSRRVTWGNRSVQCTNCSLWVHLSCSFSR